MKHNANTTDINTKEKKKEEEEESGMHWGFKVLIAISVILGIALLSAAVFAGPQYA